MLFDERQDLWGACAQGLEFSTQVEVLQEFLSSFRVLDCNVVAPVFVHSGILNYYHGLAYCSRSPGPGVPSEYACDMEALVQVLGGERTIPGCKNALFPPTFD